MSTIATEPRRSRSLLFGAGLAVATGVSAVVLSASSAALSASTSARTDGGGAATVVLTDNDAGRAIFDLPALLPGQMQVRCTTVLYEGVAAAPNPVRIFALTSGDLVDYLLIEVRVSRKESACSAQGSDWPLVMSGRLAELGADYLTGASGPTLQSGEPLHYRIAITLDPEATNAAQGRRANVDFVWEVRTP